MKLVVFVTCITDQVNLLCSESATNKSIREREREKEIVQKEPLQFRK